jgi:hypothetical protein
MREGRPLGKRTGRRPPGEIGARKEDSEKGGWAECLQFLATVRQPVFLLRILKNEVGRNEFSPGKAGGAKIRRRRQKQETNDDQQGNSYDSESFLHV